MDDDQQFCLRWNNHQSTLVSVFDTLLEKGMHVDCTLAAEGQTLKAHKVVLSACSPYFENVLSQQYDKHPIIILKDVKYAELRAMMDYMYRGEVNISQDQLAALLKAAESLQIKGLSDNKPSRPPSRPAQAAPPHPPRAASPPPQVRDGSIDSREGSCSPSRRRKKPRRMSGDAPVPIPLPLPIIPPPEVPHGNGDDTAMKEEDQREGVEDLTIDEDAEPPVVPHNDVVRNFQWHMERSQDELLNSSDGGRDSQDARPSRQSIVTRSKKVTEQTEDSDTASTFAILRPVKSPKTISALLSNKPIQEEAKENKKQPPPKALQQKPTTPTAESKNVPEEPKKDAPKFELKKDPPKLETKKESKFDSKPGTLKFNLFARERRTLPCAQYKTEKGYKCPNCQRCYNARKNLVRHVTLECGRDPQYKCPYCIYSKHRRNELKKHVARKHPDQQQPISPCPSPEPGN